jgi:hypothetical protein
MEVDEDGKTFIETGTLQGQGPDGTVLFAFPLNNLGIRLQIEPMAELEAAEAATPTG